MLYSIQLLDTPEISEQSIWLYNSTLDQDQVIFMKMKLVSKHFNFLFKEFEKVKPTIQKGVHEYLLEMELKKSSVITYTP